MKVTPFLSFEYGHWFEPWAKMIHKAIYFDLDWFQQAFDLFWICFSGMCLSWFPYWMPFFQIFYIFHASCLLEDGFRYSLDGRKINFITFGRIQPFGSQCVLDRVTSPSHDQCKGQLGQGTVYWHSGLFVYMVSLHSFN